MDKLITLQNQDQAPFTDFYLEFIKTMGKVPSYVH
jgi:hypothetical protein